MNDRLRQYGGEDIRAAVARLWELVRGAAETINASKAYKAEAEEKSSRLESSLREKDGMLAGLHEELDRSTAALGEAAAHELMLQARLSGMESTLAGKETAFGELTAELTALRRVETENTELSSKLAALDVYESELAECRERIALLQSRNSSLEGRLAGLLRIEKDFSLMQKEVARKNIELNKREIRIQELQNKIAEEDMQLYSLRKFADGRSEVSDRHDELEEENRELRKELARLIEVSETRERSEVGAEPEVPAAANEDGHLRRQAENAEIAAGLMEKITGLEAQNAGLEEKAARAAASEAEMIQLMEERDCSLSSAREKITALISLRNEFENALNRSNESLEHSQARNETLNRELEAIKAALEESRQDLAGKDGRLAAAGDKIAALESGAQMMKAELESKSAMLESLNTELARGSYERSRMETLVRDYEDKLTRSKLENEALRAGQIRLEGLEMANAEQAKIIEDYIKGLGEQEDRLKTLIADISQTKQMVSELKAQLTEEKATKEYLAAQLQVIPDLTRRNAELESHSVELESRLAVSRESLAEMKEKIEKLQAGNESRDKEIAVLAGEAKVKEEELQGLRNATRELEELRAGAIEKMEIGLENESLKNMLARSGEKLAGLESDLAAMAAELKIKEDKLHRLSGRSKELESTAAERQAMISKLENEIATLTEKNKAEAEKKKLMLQKIDRFVSILDSKAGAQ